MILFVDDLPKLREVELRFLADTKNRHLFDDGSVVEEEEEEETEQEGREKEEENQNQKSTVHEIYKYYYY